MARVYEGERTFLHPLLAPVERLTYRVCGVRVDEGMVEARQHDSLAERFDGIPARRIRPR